ncbi:MULTISPECIES: 5-dehydro-4-deoxy-D-glucuronate isomerase [unclassified Flavobacterium]|jgi:4-deoxy-L-threo-5-hexosulose-uronate ketol-isomerase|uniref:5-dehydro-4-deoxy-D-glucuronate isomerase n=1 Tax=unclassified Flavobacterium TaxID=196869 RepID=UPI00058003CC|nr:MULTISPECIES: 5-dehydro-4-deoxy-D-glucuronate isomerase [unclassified Flavobacterium]KIA94403.1 5-keto-4-deoxyuronate isomerase [Flavobacterium sp. KMS]MEA9415335.1 5-dehydro-4-deoxy-D-glucuronate isomerase [Flavobacterium sp. PL02]
MTNFEFRYATNPTDFKKYGTDELRAQFLIEKLFIENQIQLTYSMYDRYIVGGIMPVGKVLKLETIPYLKSENFLDRRELGIINVGGKGTVTVDGEVFELDKKEALYVGQGCKEVLFASANGEQALFYINSAPAHAKFPNKKVGKENAEVIQLGEEKTANRRVLNKLIVNSIVQTCQLQMGLTELLPGNVWNTMPAHTHDRRMEAYFYFDLEVPQTICHFLGETQNTRHIFMQNHQAVLSPEWSIHSGAGTSNYSFIWGMAGENLDYGDMDIVAPNELK